MLLSPLPAKRSFTSCYHLPSHIAVLDEVGGRDEKWTKEINVVAWNGGKPKIDLRDWNESHERMSRGITLLAKALFTRCYRMLSDVIS